MRMGCNGRRARGRRLPLDRKGVDVFLASRSPKESRGPTRCPSCTSDNPEGVKFCIECAAPFQKRCPNCGAENLPQAKFCDHCATPLALQPAGARPSEASLRPLAPARPEAERLQLAVLFCDLVDSTQLSAQLNPEDYRAVIRAYQATCTTVIQRYDGHLAQHMSDGLLAYFCYPTAHKHDTHRTVRTGLGIVAEVQA